MRLLIARVLAAAMREIRMELHFRREVGVHSYSVLQETFGDDMVSEAPPSEYDCLSSDAHTEDHPAAAPSPPPPWEDYDPHDHDGFDRSWLPLGRQLDNADDDDWWWPPPGLLALEREMMLAQGTDEDRIQAEVDEYLEDLEESLPPGVTVRMLT